MDQKNFLKDVKLKVFTFLIYFIISEKLFRSLICMLKHFLCQSSQLIMEAVFVNFSLQLAIVLQNKSNIEMNKPTGDFLSSKK